MVNCDNVYVAYLGKLATKKDGRSKIWRKSLGEVLRDDICKYNTDDLSEFESRVLKRNSSTIFPFDIVSDKLFYDDSVTDAKKLRGEIVFLDVDDVELADKIMSQSDAFVQRIPYVLAMWRSLRNKLHIACLCEWRRASGYNAAWKGLSTEIGSVVKYMFDSDFSEANDAVLRYPSHSISLAAGSGFECKMYEAKHYVCTIEPTIKIDEWKRADVNGYINSDPKAAAKWKSLSIAGWCRWCEREKGFQFRWYNKTVDYDQHIEILDTYFSGCRGAIEFDYWVNDGSYYRLEGFEVGYCERKMWDKRKRFVSICSYFFADVLRMDFYEALYSVCKCYLKRCLEWIPRYCDEKQIIAGKVADRCSNAGLDDSRHEYYRYKHPVLVRPYYAPSVIGGRETVMTGREQNNVRLAIKRQLAINKMIEVYEEGMRAAEMASILCVDVQTIYRYARECGMVFGKGKRGRKKGSKAGSKVGREEYVHAYTADGKRHHIRASLVDGKIYFKSKKEIKNIN